MNKRQRKKQLKKDLRFITTDNIADLLMNLLGSKNYSYKKRGKSYTHTWDFSLPKLQTQFDDGKLLEVSLINSND